MPAIGGGGARESLRTVLIVLALLAACHVVPARAENVVRWATPLPADSFDPYGHDELFTIWVERQVYEALIDYDRDGRLEPRLATSWKRVDAQTWELELRQGVAFHDSTPLSSADVVLSIERAKAETSPYRNSLSNIAGVEAVDTDTVRFTAATANPIPWEDLSVVAIMSEAWAERRGAALPSQLGDDRGTTSRLTQWHRPVHTRGVRAWRAHGSGPQPQLVGPRAAPRTISIGSCRPGSPIRLTVPGCSSPVRSTCSSRRRRTSSSGSPPPRA